MIKEETSIPRLPIVTASLADRVTAQEAIVEDKPLIKMALPSKRTLIDPDAKYARAEITAIAILAPKRKIACSINCKYGGSKGAPPILKRATVAITAMKIRRGISPNFFRKLRL